MTKLYKGKKKPQTEPMTTGQKTPEELEALLIQFIEFYNDRPHQGAELDGLSPNEFANRIWLM